MADQKFLFFGAGEAACGIANLLADALIDDGLSREDALAHCYLFDSKGLVTKARTDLAAHKQPFAVDAPDTASFLEAVKTLKPTAIIGVAGQPQTFTKEVLEEMAKLNERPIIFALSNPTSKAECTAEQAYTATKGKALFASGVALRSGRIRRQDVCASSGQQQLRIPGSRSRRGVQPLEVDARRDVPRGSQGARNARLGR